MAKEEWILGQSVEAQTVYEWVDGQPYILVEEEEAPPVGMAGAMTTNTGYWGY